METEGLSTVLQSNMNILWIMIAAAMVMMMQAGFTALESGLTQAKNTINVAAKNVTDFIVSVLVFWLVGFGLMFGASSAGIFGTTGFGLSGMNQPMDYASFVFQATFAGTAATIVSGAVAERMRFTSYVIVSIAITAIVYPVSGHWVWNADGWLAKLQMVDFAGSTVVHSLGAWVGLAGAWILGPRMNRFNEDGTPNHIPGHNLVLGVVGVLILWFGWFGFNGGSTLEANVSIAKIVANTMLAAAAGGVSCFLVSQLTSNVVSIEKMLNGIIGGLVGITAGCAVVEPGGAVAIGLVAGVVVWISEWMMIHIFRIDDPVNVVPAHGFAGAWGTIALALFAPVTALPLADRLSQLGVQLLGVGAVFVWGFGLGVLLFSVLKMVDFLRVDPEGEQAGLNISEHGARSGMFDTMNAMWQIATAQQGGDGDLTRRIHVEIGTEAGDLATIFNKFMDGFESIIAKFGLSITTLSGASTRLNSISDKLSVGAKKQLDETQDISIAVHQLSATISEVAQNTALTAQAAQQAAIEAAEGKKVVMDSVSMMDRLANEVQSASAVVSKLKQNAKEIDSMVQVINDISEQTNLLALNASIEAARAGEAGRGFAIVADEVRQLSTRTREATMQIKAVVDNLSIGTDQAVSVMDHSHDISKSTVESAHKSANLLSEITQSVEKISDMSSQIAAAAEEQSATTEEISRGMESIKTVAEQSYDSVTWTAECSHELTSLTSDLNGMVGSFKLGNVVDGDFVHISNQTKH